MDYNFIYYPNMKICQKLIKMNNHFSFSNFIKKDEFKQTYDYTKHTLLNNLYMFGYNNDNIGYVLHDSVGKNLIGIDFGEFDKSRKIVEKLEDDLSARLTYILTTHSHWDHSGGNNAWKEYRNDVEIVTGTNKDDLVPAATKFMNDLETFSLGELCIACMHTPGHIPSHVCWVITQVTENSTKLPFLFCGDTLFIGGCGRVFNGTHEQLYNSLQTLGYLPNDTLVFCGHEYTANNLKFALKLDPENDFIKDKIEWVDKLRTDGQFTVGSRLVEEKLYNPFMRCNDRYYKDLTNEEIPEKVFKKLRILKDNF
jgi:hydroxyacylglutathione hydrolase